MKKNSIVLTMALALLLTACGTDLNAATTVSTTSVQTIAATTAASTAAQTTAAAVSSTAAQTTTATVSSTAAQTTAASVSSTAALTTASKPATSAKPNHDEISFTVSGHIWIWVNDIITEYGGKQLSEGIVLYNTFQNSPEIMTLPLDVCSKMQKEHGYTVEFKDAQITDPVDDTFLYKTEGADGWVQWCINEELLSKHAKLGIVREPKEGEQGLDCDLVTWNGLPDDVQLKEWKASEVVKPGAFTAELVKQLDEDPNRFQHGALILLKDGKPVLEQAWFKKAEKLEPGKQYQFTVSDTDTFYGITAAKTVDSAK